MNDSQVSRRGGARGGDPGVGFPELNQVLKHPAAPRQRGKHAVSDQRLDSVLKNRKAGDAGAERDRRQDRRTDERDAVVFPGEYRHLSPRHLPPGELQTDRQDEEPGRGVHGDMAKRVSGEEQFSAYQIARQPKHADGADAESQ